jgi:hypothetical protein
MSDCDLFDAKHPIIDAKIKSGAISKRDRKYLQEFVNTNQVRKKAGLISGREASCLKRFTQSFIRDVKADGRTAKALAKLNEKTRAAFMLNYGVGDKLEERKLKEHSAKANAVKILSVAGAHIETNAKIM